MAAHYPPRIDCLTEETCETLYPPGAQARIVGVSGFTVRPPPARTEKPKVAVLTSTKTDKILVRWQKNAGNNKNPSEGADAMAAHVVLEARHG